MHAIDNRILISGAYREDDGTAARCIGIIRRGAALYMAKGDPLAGVDLPVRAPALKKTVRNRAKKTFIESLEIANYCEKNAHKSAKEIAEELKEPVYTIRYACEKFGIQLRAVLLKGRAA